MDVPIPFAGTVIELHGKGGDTLKVGTPLITVSGGESVDAVVSANHERYREEERAGSGNVLIGYGTSEDAPLRRRRAAPSVRVISPIVRKLASDNSIDLATISGSGAGGVHHARRRRGRGKLRPGNGNVTRDRPKNSDQGATQGSCRQAVHQPPRDP